MCWIRTYKRVAWESSVDLLLHAAAYVTIYPKCTTDHNRLGYYGACITIFNLRSRASAGLPLKVLSQLQQFLTVTNTSPAIAELISRGNWKLTQINGTVAEQPARPLPQKKLTNIYCTLNRENDIQDQILSLYNNHRGGRYSNTKNEIFRIPGGIVRGKPSHSSLREIPN